MAEDSRYFRNPPTETLSRENIRAMRPKNFCNLLEHSQNNSIEQ
jgi:hypothetical protein